MLIWRHIPKKENVNGYTHLISEARWHGLEPSFSSELLHFIVCLIVLASQGRFALWEHQGATSCGQTNKWSLEMAVFEYRLCLAHRCASAHVWTAAEKFWGLNGKCVRNPWPILLLQKLRFQHLEATASTRIQENYEPYL